MFCFSTTNQFCPTSVIYNKSRRITALQEPILTQYFTVKTIVREPTVLHVIIILMITVKLAHTGSFRKTVRLSCRWSWFSNMAIVFKRLRLRVHLQLHPTSCHRLCGTKWFHSGINISPKINVGCVFQEIPLRFNFLSLRRVLLGNLAVQ